MFCLSVPVPRWCTCSSTFSCLHMVGVWYIHSALTLFLCFCLCVTSWQCSIHCCISAFCWLYCVVLLIGTCHSAYGCAFWVHLWLLCLNDGLTLVGLCRLPVTFCSLSCSLCLFCLFCSTCHCILLSFSCIMCCSFYLWYMILISVLTAMEVSWVPFFIVPFFCSDVLV
jgi:hypothetical protein